MHILENHCIYLFLEAAVHSASTVCARLGREKFTKQLMFVRASSVFIAGGTLGSTEIMLR